MTMTLPYFVSSRAASTIAILVVLLSSLSSVPLSSAQSTTATTAIPTTSEEVIVNPGGTCGGGDRGNGICANGKCCSKFGWCGITPAHCDGETLPPTLSPSPSIASTSLTSGAATDSPTIISITLPDNDNNNNNNNNNNNMTTLQPMTASPTTLIPTLQPIYRDWSLITPGHTSFCGPKIVGGYELAKANCSFVNECEKSQVAGETHFGVTGNDCPAPLMCFTDIICEPPTTHPSYVPSARPSSSVQPTVTASNSPSAVPSTSNAPTPKGQTKHPTYMPTVSNDPTVNPTVNPDNIVNSMTTRASFCGSSYEMAVNSCSKATLCTTDEDCSSSSSSSSGSGNGGFSDALCFPDISCSSDTAEWNGNNNNEDFNINSLNSGGGQSHERIISQYYSSGATIMMILLVIL